MAVEKGLPYPDRRSSDRFPIERDVKYKMLDGKTVLRTGAGKTVDMSSGGVLFTTEEPLSAGNRLELSVNWPAQLDNSCPLKLVALGPRGPHRTGQGSHRDREIRVPDAGLTNIYSGPGPVVESPRGAVHAGLTLPWAIADSAGLRQTAPPTGPTG